MRAHCARCRHEQIFVRAKVHHLAHFVATVLTFGLWLVSWAAVTIGSKMRPWRCEHCGWHAPSSLRKPARRAVDPAAEENAPAAPAQSSHEATTSAADPASPH